MISETEVKSMLLQRRILGILCILLAPCSLLLGLIGAKYNEPYWWSSISSTYYANSKIIMIGLLFSTSVFFFSYKGYDIKDRICSLIEAISAAGIIIFPNAGTQLTDVTGVFCLPIHTSDIIHCSFAMTLFITFGVNIIFLFTLGDKTNPKKKLRNKIYYTCGIGIILGILSQVICTVIGCDMFHTPITTINEVVMLTSFGFAYLVKSEAIFKLNDPKVS